ncbi:hypothetical protein CEW87_03975 [Parazoarcus communis]|uniref:Phage head morphogenesis domain-containing protein n=2 Tax=Parazoarcus communis TaxID=41977 RepID=A0A2U8GYA8_9RHOO|nr:hypothetical protein CEW87_03975 [Parazoarcus communis]
MTCSRRQTRIVSPILQMIPLRTVTPTALPSLSRRWRNDPGSDPLPVLWRASSNQQPRLAVRPSPRGVRLHRVPRPGAGHRVPTRAGRWREGRGRVRCRLCLEHPRPGGRMTPTEAILAALKGRTRLINGTTDELKALLAEANKQVMAILASAPSDYQQWLLPQLRAEIGRVMEALGTEAAAVVDGGQVAAWRGGSAMVDSSLAASGISAALPQLDVVQLGAMRSFLTEKISGISTEAANRINTQLGLVTMGAQTPFDAIKAVTTTLNEATYKRATTIVHTELNRAFSTANQLRMEQSAEAVPGLKKRWVQSGKREPRPEHVAIHGQEQPVDKPFLLEGGAVKLMYPGDPTGPARHTINCGCVSVPVVPKDNPYGLKRTTKDPADAEKARARAALKAAQSKG